MQRLVRVEGSWLVVHFCSLVAISRWALPCSNLRERLSLPEVGLECRRWRQFADSSVGGPCLGQSLDDGITQALLIELHDVGIWGNFADRGIELTKRGRVLPIVMFA